MEVSKGIVADTRMLQKSTHITAASRAQKLHRHVQETEAMPPHTMQATPYKTLGSRSNQYTLMVRTPLASRKHSQIHGRRAARALGSSGDTAKNCTAKNCTSTRGCRQAGQASQGEHVHKGGGQVVGSNGLHGMAQLVHSVLDTLP
jgi:hypothetical protein